MGFPSHHITSAKGRFQHPATNTSCLKHLQKSAFILINNLRCVKLYELRVLKYQDTLKTKITNYSAGLRSKN